MLDDKPSSTASPPLPVAAKGRSRGFYAFGLVTVALAFAAAGYLRLTRSNDVALARSARESLVERGPRVEVVAATKGPDKRTITLLADVRSNAVATIYSKVSGYIKSVNVDRGDKVEEGQFLAQIESPELDYQYAAAQTDLLHKRRNRERISGLFAKGTSTQVAMFNSENDANVAEANVKGIETLKGYQTVRAPFAGRVTARFADPGALVTNAQTNIVSALPILTISDDSRLRVFAYVQQQDVPFVSIGDVAEVYDASNQDRRRMAKVTRMTGELDAKARAMQIEVNIDNRDQFLAAGSFAYVTLHVPIRSYAQIPVSGLIVRGNDRMVAVVENEVLRYKPIVVASTTGNVVAIASGLAAGEMIAINLPDEVVNGSRVQPIAGKR